MEKRKPHFSLTDIKTAFADPAVMNRSFVSKQGANALRMNDRMVIDIIQALKNSDFDKSMTAHARHQVWQDVYKPIVNGTELYVKFTTDAMGAFLLISFKGA